jgi:hypothetical protein
VRNAVGEAGGEGGGRGMHASTHAPFDLLGPAYCLASTEGTLVQRPLKKTGQQLLNQLAEEGADEAARRHLIPNRVVRAGSEGSAAPAAAAAGGREPAKNVPAQPVYFFPRFFFGAGRPVR